VVDVPLIPATVTAAGGFVFGLSLIVVIGAQNTFVLQTGLRRERILTVVAVCAGSDVALIAAGVAGGGAALHGRAWLLETVRIGGAVFLLAYGLLAARRAWCPVAAAAGDAGPAMTNRSIGAIIATALALTWLNPGVYLDTVVLLGSVANSHAGQQWWFGAGAAGASVAWFAGLGYGARRLGFLFARPNAWRGLDAFVALSMLITGVRVLLSA
jgi:L-lysine exporter family protein LysE/ArgO